MKQTLNKIGALTMTRSLKNISTFAGIFLGAYFLSTMMVSVTVMSTLALWMDTLLNVLNFCIEYS